MGDNFKSPLLEPVRRDGIPVDRQGRAGDRLASLHHKGKAVNIVEMPGLVDSGPGS